MSEATPAPTPVPTPPPGSRVDAPPGVDYPGKVLGIVGLVLAFPSAIIGLIISIVANNQSKAAGFTNTPAKIGIIVGIVMTVIGVIIGIAAIVFGIAAANAVIEACKALGEGVHVIDGVTYTCG